MERPVKIGRLVDRSARRVCSSRTEGRLSVSSKFAISWMGTLSPPAWRALPSFFVPPFPSLPFLKAVVQELRFVLEA